MNPLITRIGVSAVAAVAVVGLIAAGNPDVTKARLEASLTSVYTNLYLQRGEILGQTGLTATSIAARSDCDRGGPDVQDSGAGSDWICMVQFIDADGQRQNGKFEIAAKSNACYVATGPSRINGPIMITDTRGRDVLNPVFEFDACYDPAA